MRGQSARPHTVDRFDSSTDKSLRAYGGYYTGMASTFAGALQTSREAVIEAVDGPDAIDTFISLNGNRGTDEPGGSTNRIESEEYDRTGVDRVFIAVTEEQFEALADRVGAEVSIG
ncbi:MAG: hypothetical protein ABEL97_06805 [Salinibacter sp.]